MQTLGMAACLVIAIVTKATPPLLLPCHNRAYSLPLPPCQAPQSGSSEQVALPSPARKPLTPSLASSSPCGSLLLPPSCAASAPQSWRVVRSQQLARKHPVTRTRCLRVLGLAAPALHARRHDGSPCPACDGVRISSNGWQGMGVAGTFVCLLRAGTKAAATDSSFESFRSTAILYASCCCGCAAPPVTVCRAATSALRSAACCCAAPCSSSPSATPSSFTTARFARAAQAYFPSSLNSCQLAAIDAAASSAEKGVNEPLLVRPPPPTSPHRLFAAC